MIALRPFHKVGILGDFQTGKTTFAAWLLSQVLRFVAWDPTWAMDAAALRAVIVHDIPSAKRALKDHGRVILQPPMGVDLKKAFAQLCGWMLRESNVTLFIDEPAMVGLDSNASSMPQELSDLWRLGHKRGIGVWWATHRYHAEVPRIMRVVLHWFIFRLSDENDIAAISEKIGVAGAQHVAQLPNYHFWHKGPEHNGPVLPIDPAGVTRAPTSDGQVPAADGKADTS